MTDGRGEEQEFFYDKLDRIVDIHYGDAHTHWVSFAYDGNGNLTAQTNDARLDQAYVYDKLNRRVEETLPETGFWNQYTYDKSSNLKSITDQNQTVTYSYDDVDRVASITAPNESGTGTEASTFAYTDDASPRVRTATLPSGATERTEYDKSGKITKVISKTSANKALRERTYTYTEGSTPRARIQSVTDENKLTTSYSYRDGSSVDRSSLIEAKTRDGASNVITNFRYAYDKAGNRTSRQVTPVLAGEQTVREQVDSNEPGMAEAFKTTAQASGSTAALRVYIDAANTTSSVKVGLYADNAGDPGSLLASATLSSPQAGKWNTVALTGASVTKGTAYWIAILQPEGTTGTAKFRDEPDATGGAAQTSSQNTLTALPGAWSAGSNWPSAPISAYLTTTAVQITSYAYNAANQLCWSVTGTSSAACGSPPAGATGYSYDEAGSQLTGDRTLAYHHFHTDTISTGTGNIALQFLGADQNQLWDVDGTRYQENLLGLSHQSTGETYVRDPDTGAVHSMTKNGDKRFFLHDDKNSTLGLLSPDESIERSYSYDPDGNATATGTGAQSVVQWVGGVNLESQGIYHFGARLYNPAIGRWTQPDPLNQPADLLQANLYSYVGGDPINRIDPSGEIFITVGRLVYLGARAAARNPRVRYTAGKYATKAVTKAREIAEKISKVDDYIEKWPF